MDWIGLMCNPDEAVQDPFLARVLAGATRLELKTEFNLSADTLYRRLKRLKEKGIESIPPIRHLAETNDKRETILTKAGEGLGATQIARELGMPKSTVTGIIARARSTGGLPPPVPRKLKALPQISTEAIEKRLRWNETMVGGCRWIEGKLPLAWHWCGQPVISPDSPYCEQHYNRIHGIRSKEKLDI